MTCTDASPAAKGNKSRVLPESGPQLNIRTIELAVKQRLSVQFDDHVEDT